MPDSLTRQRDARQVQRAKDYRSQAARDRDRILYSYEFRRLASVTQVVSVAETELFHNRLTHSLKVGQVGRRLAERLAEKYPKFVNRGEGLDPDVVESACLAHDIGHPPFGHIAESELQEKLKLYSLDSFEGNAQSFRIVTKLAFRTRELDQPALNLTRATLRAILKYPWHYEDHPTDRYSDKWGAYLSEGKSFEFAMDLGQSATRSLEADIMDWADDITYAVHDLEDFFRAGLIPLHLIASTDSYEAGAFIEGASSRLAKEGYQRGELEIALQRLRARGFIPTKPYGGERRDREAMMDRTSFLMTTVVDATRVDSRGQLHIEPDVRTEIDLLKQLTWQYVIENPALNTLQQGQRKVIGDLFDCLVGWVEDVGDDERGRRTLPRRLDAYLSATGADSEAKRVFDADDNLVGARAVTDYIASLTEAQALNLHRRVLGGTATSAIETWLAT